MVQLSGTVNLLSLVTLCIEMAICFGTANQEKEEFGLLQAMAWILKL